MTGTAVPPPEPERPRFGLVEGGIVVLIVLPVADGFSRR
jgi:hypothetical protein